jgi:predicted dehydrogenase
VAEPWQPREPEVELRRPAGHEAVEREVIPVDPADSYLLELENVSGAILGETALLLGRSDAVGQARALDALQRSARIGTAVELEPASSGVR